MTDVPVTAPAAQPAGPGRSVLTAPLPLDRRRESGRAARDRLPLADLGRWSPEARDHDALQTILAQNSMRDADLAPLRMGRMSASPWTYYRGAAAVMAADLGGGARARSGIDVQLCGDAHVLNFGLWATPERQISFDLRDFDETIRGPFEWDVQRFLASLVVIARDTGAGDRVAADAVAAATREYREQIRRYAGAGELEIWYDLITDSQLLTMFDEEEREQHAARLARRAARRTSAGAARKLTEVVDGRLRIVADPPIRTRPEDVPGGVDVLRGAAEITQAYLDTLPYERRYLLDRFTFVDAVRQVVGVGSVGMRVYLALLEGRRGGDPLFLQIKQAGPSVYEPYVGASPATNHGERVIRGKRVIQAAGDIFLGWTRFDDKDFYVRQFRDMKVIANGALIAPYLVAFATRCAAVLARAHARTGDAAMIDGYIGKGGRFDASMARFARRYADQTALDHAQLVSAIESGEVPAQLG